MERYKVVVNHGERETVFSVVDTQSSESEQPDVVASYGTGKYASGAERQAKFVRDTFNERGNR